MSRTEARAKRPPSVGCAKAQSSHDGQARPLSPRSGIHLPTIPLRSHTAQDILSNCARTFGSSQRVRPPCTEDSESTAIPPVPTRRTQSRHPLWRDPTICAQNARLSSLWTASPLDQSVLPLILVVVPSCNSSSRYYVHRLSLVGAQRYMFGISPPDTASPVGNARSSVTPKPCSPDIEPDFFDPNVCTLHAGMTRSVDLLAPKIKETSVGQSRVAAPRLD